jgi:glycosyltransferase involved in cell wall biosynthesis
MLAFQMGGVDGSAGEGLPLKALVLTSDAFGCLGGIAQYNRDFLEALCSHPRLSEVVVAQRNITAELEPMPSRLRLLRGAANDKRAFALEIGRTLMTSRFDLVICGHINLLPLAYAAHIAHRAPLWLLTYGIEAWQAPPSRLVARLASRVAGFAAISDITRKRFVAWAKPSRATDGYILPNAIRLEHYSPGEKPADLLEHYGLRGRRVLMTLARLSAAERYKGVDEVIESLPALPDDVSYLVCGDGDDRARLEEKVHSLGLTNRVFFAGRIADARKADYFRLADAFVMPGRGEGFGFVFLEALACGIPVVASKVDGSREAVRDGMLGILVDPDQRQELIAGLLSVLEQPKGTVPDGLSYFAYPSFERRCHDMIDDAIRAVPQTVRSVA